MAWNRPGEKKVEVERKGGQRNVHLKGLIAGAIVVLGAGLAAWLLTNGEAASSPLQKKDRGRIKEVKPVSAGAADAVASSKLEKTNKAERTKGMLADGNNPNTSLSSLPPVGDMPTPPPPKEVFDNPSDQLIAMTLNGSKGETAPLPFDDTLEVEFKKSLEKPIVINDDDPESVKAVKQRVMDAREDIKVLLKEGKTVRQILQEHREDVNFKAGIQRDTALEARRILDSGDVEGAKKYVTIMNLALQQMGIEEIDMPLTKEQIQEQRLQRLQEIKAQGGAEK